MNAGNTVGRRIAVIAMMAATHCLAQSEDIHLAGPQDGAYERANYLVDSTVVVENGKTLVFEPGCVVRFKQYGEIRVEGELVVRGTLDGPIHLTSWKHRPPSEGGTAPAPYDWNGIVLADSDASLTMTYTRLVYGTIGVTVKAAGAVVDIDSCSFDHNGIADIAAGGPEFFAPKGKLFSYHTKPRVSGTAVAVTTTTTATETGGNRRHPRWVPVVRWTACGLAVAGLAAGIAGEYMARSYQQQGNDASSGADADDFYGKRDAMVAVRTVGYVTGGLGAVGFTVTWFF